jgi:hypothetical protein
MSSSPKTDCKRHTCPQMQQLHHASLKALKKRHHAASAFRRASLSVDAEAVLAGLRQGTAAQQGPDMQQQQEQQRQQQRRHSLGGSGDLDALLGLAQGGHATSL